MKVPLAQGWPRPEVGVFARSRHWEPKSLQLRPQSPRLVLVMVRLPLGLRQPRLLVAACRLSVRSILWKMSVCRDHSRMLVHTAIGCFSTSRFCGSDIAQSAFYLCFCVADLIIDNVFLLVSELPGFVELRSVSACLPSRAKLDQSIPVSAALKFAGSWLCGASHGVCCASAGVISK